MFPSSRVVNPANCHLASLRRVSAITYPRTDCSLPSDAVIVVRVQGLEQLLLYITARATPAAPSDSSLVLGGSH